MQIRRRQKVAISIATGMMLVGATAATLAQDEVSSIIPAGLNADTVDGRHAVGHGASPRKRAGKLVATDNRGHLPNDIVKPKWGLIGGKPAALRDGRIGWGEIHNKPPGFADGVDDAGITGATITTVSGAVVTVAASGGQSYAFAFCPAGSRAVGGGFTGTSFDLNIAVSGPASGSSRWAIAVKNPTAFPQTVRAMVQCLTLQPAAAFNTARRGPKLAGPEK